MIDGLKWWHWPFIIIALIVAWIRDNWKRLVIDNAIFLAGFITCQYFH